MFKNYVRDPRSHTPINLAISRILLSFYLVWKILSTRWERVNQYPVMDERPSIVVLKPLYPDTVMQHVEIVQYIAVAVLLTFAIGIFIRAAAFLSSFLVCYLGVIHYMADTSWSTQMLFAASILLMLYALYAEQDEFSIDGLRRQSAKGPDALNNHLESPLTRKFESTPLLIFLPGLGVLYFGAAVGKLVEGGLGWISPTNLGRHMDNPWQLGYFPEIGRWLAQFDFVLFIGAFGTIVFQLGLLLAIILSTRKMFTMVIFGLLSMHISIMLFMGPVFIYTIVFLLLFVDWGAINDWLESDNEVVIHYDSSSFTCVRALYFLKYLDTKNNILFQDFSEDSGISSCENNDFDHTIILTMNDGVYKGYSAFFKFFNHFRFLYPIYLFMTLRPVEFIGKRLYYRFF